MNTYIAFQAQVPPNCPVCGHLLHDSWEGVQHRIGKHGYRTWTPQDGQRQIDAMQAAVPKRKTPG